MNMNTNQTKLHTLGIDIGSTTVKVAILNEKNELLFSDYERHYANIQETLSALLKKAYDSLGELSLSPMITGSGGLPLPSILVFLLFRKLLLFLLLFRTMLRRQM